MKRTSKALARIGIGAVTTAAILSTPLALGTASADPSFAGGNLVATGSPSAANNTDPVTSAYGTNAPLSIPPAAQNTITAGAATLFAYHNGATPQTLAFSITGSSGTAYFLRQTDQTAPGTAFTVADATHATCTTTAGLGATDQYCGIKIADTAPEGLTVTVTDAGDSTFTSGTVVFNGMHYTQCSQTGVNIPAGAAGDPNICKTQGTVNASTTETVTYLEGGVAAANKNVQFIITLGPGQFTAAQPAGTSQVDTTHANCTTDSSGKCSFNVVDATSNSDTQVTGTLQNPTPNFGNTTAGINIHFQSANVAAAELDLDKSSVIAPGNQDGSQFAEPGDVIQNVYTLRGSPVAAGAGSPVCVPVAPAPVCPGVVLANQTFTLKVSNGFFTPNCGSGNPVEAAAPGYPNVPTLGNNNYANCTFNAAPAAGKAVGDLKSSGQSIDLKTDDNGQVIVSLGIAKDAGFDDDGFVVAAVSDGSIVPQVEGDANNPSGANCSANSFATLDPDLTAPPALPSADYLSGCNVDSAWSTDEAPLNGGTVKDIVVPAIRNPNNNFIETENNDNATDSGTNNVPDVDRVVWVLHLTDQYGNLTSNSDVLSVDPAAAAGVQKTGPGNIVICHGFTSVDACTGPGTAIPGATQPDGTVTQLTSLDGSYTNNDPDVQERIEADANTAKSGSVVNCYPDDCSDPGHGVPGNPGVNDGTQTDTSGWQPEVTTFANFIAGSPAFATYTPQGAAATPSVDTLTINFYNQLAQAVVTFSVKPGHKVPTSTAVTVTGTVSDQFQHPIVDAAMQIVRSGANEGSCTPIQDTNENQFIFTNQAGKGGYTFSCNQAGASTVNIVVTGPGGTQLAAGKEVVHFTGNSAHLTKEKPTLKLKAKGHKVTLKVKTHPAVHGKTVNFYKINKHGISKLFGQDKTSKSGVAKLHVHLKSGKYHFEAKVQGLKATKYNSKFSKTKKLVV